MSEFVAVLRNRVEDAQRGLELAQEAGHDHEVHLHCARLRDLLDRAEAHGVDTTGWVAPAALSFVAGNCG